MDSTQLELFNQLIRQFDGSLHAAILLVYWFTVKQANEIAPRIPSDSRGKGNELPIQQGAHIPKRVIGADRSVPLLPAQPVHHLVELLQLLPVRSVDVVIFT